MDRWIEEIKEIMAKARQWIASDVNGVMLDTYWKLGKANAELLAAASTSEFAEF